ncbi:MAG: ZIP family metal transporter [Candidatus Schekmanbacteria bacterium]|nr:MAG: ZIP family metal transporter [Candidatus Schekmanbacteria bacterium]
MQGTAFLYSFIAAVGSLIGMLLLLWKEKWARTNSIKLISLSGGIFLGIVFIHLLPESIEINENALWYCLGGFISFYLLESLFLFHSHSDEEPSGERHHKFGMLAVVGLFIHSMFDGIGIGAGFEIDARLGFLAVVAVLSHKVPDGIAIAGILFHARESLKKVVLYSVVISLATPLGTFLVGIFFKNIEETVVGALLAFASGFFLYISASDLIPQTHNERNALNFVILTVGVLLMYILKVIT